MSHDLRSFLARLEEEDELVHVDHPLSPRFEIPAVIKHIGSKRDVAIQFDRVKGYQVPVVGNLFGSKRRLAIAMETREEEMADKIYNARKNPVEPKLVENGPVNEVKIHGNVDILQTMLY